MDSKVKDAMAKVLEDPVDGVNVKLDKVLELLKENFLAVEMQLRPAELLVHPGNRGGSMVSPHDVHRKGQNVVNTGLKRSLLAASSLCVELPRLPHVRKEQIEKNQTLCNQAEGLLGGVLGQEGYLTLGCSHWVQYCRAMEQGAMGPNGEKLHVPAELKSLLSAGWKWTALKPEVEEAFPAFPSWAASSLNSSNANVKATSELEAMLEIANLVRQGKTVAQAVEAVKAGLPSCAEYLDYIGHFVKLFCGGDQFPLLQVMKDFCTKYGPSILIGKEMMYNLSCFDFKMETNKLPMTRAALLCTMLTSKKHSDGLSRLIYKADFDRMRGTLKSNTQNVEEILKDAWEQCQKSSTHKSLMAWGKLGTRMILHILSKEKYSRDAPFESVQKIVERFAEDLESSHGPSASTGTSAGVMLLGAKVAQNSDIFKAELKRIELQHILLEGFKDHITDVR
ncbi:unnamed protein product, partial [Durusdinium trenchii]